MYKVYLYSIKISLSQLVFSIFIKIQLCVNIIDYRNKLFNHLRGGLLNKLN
jgi:hypothetical protein